MKNIVVTGASKGIGFEVAKTLAGQGHRVYVLARSGEKLKELSEQMPSKIIPFSCDLTKPEQIEEFVSSLDSDASLDVLINNAGYLINKPFVELTSSDWMQMIDANLFSAVHLIKALKNRLNSGSHIVNVGSMGGFHGSSKFPGLSAYSAAKGALTILSECLATEFINDGISVNCLCLGAVQTQMLEEAFPGYQAPLQPTQMGEFIADFSINGHKFFNGKALPVSLHNPG